MRKTRSDIENDAMQLSSRDRAWLARRLIATLDTGGDDDAEDRWLERAEKRYQAYRDGHIESRSVEEVFQDAESRLK